MSTRLFFSPHGAGITVAPHAEWDHAPLSERRTHDHPNLQDSFLLSLDRTATPVSGIEEHAYDYIQIYGGGPGAYTGGVQLNVGVARFITEPLAAQTIDCNFMSLAHCYGQYGTTNVTTNIGLRVVSGDGSTVRGTLLAPHSAATIPYEVSSSGSSRIAKYPPQWNTGTQPTGVPLSAVNAQEGDRIVAEYGVRIYPSSSNTLEYWMYIIPRGDIATDLVGGTQDMIVSGINSSTAHQQFAWMEFSQDLVWSSGAPSTDGIFLLNLPLPS